MCFAQAPQAEHPRSSIALAAVPSPHEGTSYNPPVTAHQELLRAAHEAEEEKLRGADELEAVKAKMEKARTVAAADEAAGTVEGVAPGMTVGEVAEDAEEDGAEPLPPKKMPGRKTKQQRKKAEQLVVLSVMIAILSQVRNPQSLRAVIQSSYMLASSTDTGQSTGRCTRRRWPIAFMEQKNTFRPY